ncbi:MAG: tetratricopeptide repeat protein [Bacteroidota bacterium]
MSKKTKKQSSKKSRKASKLAKAPSFWQNSDHLIKIAIVLTLTFAVFYGSLSNQFVNWDDDVNILENPNLEVFDWASVKAIFSDHVIGGYNPLTILTFALEKHFFGLEPFVFHLNNLLLHLICVFFVYRILLLLRLSPTAAMIGALLFGIHPMRVESVAWVTERKDVLFGAFYLAATYYYVKYLQAAARNKGRLFAIILLLFALSLLSKIQAVALPLTFLALDYYFERPLKWQRLTEKIPYFALSLLVGILGIVVLANAETISSEDPTQYNIFERLLVGAYSFCTYMAKCIFPYEMLPLYPYPRELGWMFYAAPLGVLPILAWIYLAFQKQQRAVVFAWAVFLFNVVFVLQILAAGQGFKADRFTYIPYLGLFFLMAWGIDRLIEKKPDLSLIAYGGSAIYLLVFAYMTHQQIRIWENGDTLWTHVIESGSKTALPWGNRGNYWRSQKDYQQSLRDYQQAIKLAPDKPNPYNSLGKTYFDMGNAAQALEQYDRAIELNADEVEFWVNRGAAKATLGQLDQALLDLNQAEKIDPDFKNLYLNRSLIFTKTGRFQQALQDHNKYLELDPYYAAIYYERAIVKRQLGDDAAALPDLNRAIELDASMGVFFYERAKILARQNRMAEARQDVQMAQQRGTQIDPAFLKGIQ